MFTSPNYSPDKVAKRYLRCDVRGEFKLIEANAAGFTTRESVPNLTSYPAEKVQRARELKGQLFGAVEV